MSVALKLVEAKQFCDEVAFDGETASRGLHSLHSAFAHKLPWQPAIARYVLDRFSSRGDSILDTHCGAGSLGLEVMLSGRHFTGVTNDGVMARLAQARLDPADLAEVALRVQLVNLNRPIDVRGFAAPFTLFYDVDTFCELVNLKSSLRGSTDRVDRFTQFVVASVMHGHTVAYLSGYTSPHVGLSAEAQAQLNRKRNEVPSYRALAPRILRKAAALLQDGVPSAMQQGDLRASVIANDPRNMNGVATASIDLAMVSPDQPGFADGSSSSWLRNWWIGVDGAASKQTGFSDADGWRMHCNESLLELARVVRRGGRAVVRVGQGRLGSKVLNYREQLSAVMGEGLGSYWSIEGTIVERLVSAAGLAKSSSDKGRSSPGELVVLRRR